MEILTDTQGRWEYIHSLQETIYMNYRKMTEQEVTLEETVCRHNRENYPIHHYIEVMKIEHYTTIYVLLVVLFVCLVCLFVFLFQSRCCRCGNPLIPS